MNGNVIGKEVMDAPFRCIGEGVVLSGRPTSFERPVISQLLVLRGVLRAGTARGPDIVAGLIVIRRGICYSAGSEPSDQAGTVGSVLSGGSVVAGMGR